MQINKLLFIGLIMLFAISCGKNSEQQLSSKNYKHNGQSWKSVSITQELNAIQYKATEVPLYYYLLKNAPSKVDSLYDKNKRERILEIEFQAISDADLLQKEYTHKDYDSSVKYMAFTIKKDFQVITSNKDTVPCSGVLFERNFKVAPFKRVMLYFNNIDPEETISLLYNDELFGNGLIKFNFSERPIKL